MTKQFLTSEFLLADESFQHWLSHKASLEENEQWSDWLHSDHRNQELYHEAVELWQLAQFQSTPVPDVNHEWQKMQHRLKLKPAKRASIINFNFQNISPRWLFSVREFLPRYAAIAAVIILIVYFFQIKHSNNPAFQVVNTEYGQRVRITLPESTTVILNANSTLRYPSDWNKKTIRQFELQGEAYFIVSSRPNGTQNNFIVTTNDGEVQVVGTRFGVYKRGNGTRVAVEEGNVKIFVASDIIGQNKVSDISVLLKPGDLLNFQKGDSTLYPQSVDVRVYTSWWSDQLVFNNSPFKDIVNRLEETYNIKIKVRDNLLLKRCLTGSIENSSLQIITEALSKALQVSVHQKGNVIIFGN